MTEEARFHNAGKTLSSKNGAGKTGQPHVKEIKDVINIWVEIIPCPRIGRIIL